MKITSPKHLTPGPWRATPDGVEPERPTWSTPYIAAIDERGTLDALERAANATAIAATHQTLNANQFGLSLALEMHQHQGVLDALANAGLIDAFLEQIERARQALTAAGYTITP